MVWSFARRPMTPMRILLIGPNNVDAFVGVLNVSRSFQKIA